MERRENFYEKAVVSIDALPVWNQLRISEAGFVSAKTGCKGI